MEVAVWTALTIAAIVGILYAVDRYRLRHAHHR